MSDAALPTPESSARGEEFRIRSRDGLPPEVVQRLARLSPLRTTLSLVENFGTIAVLVALAVRLPHPALIAACVLGIAARQHGLAILAHQAAHYRLYRTRWLNDLAGRACAVPLGISMITYRVIHRLHHNHLYEAVDPDLALMAGYPRGRAYLARKLLKDLLGITTIKNYLYFFGRPAGEASRRELDDTSPTLRAQAARDRKLVLALQAALFVALAVTGLWPWFLLLWVLPLVTVLQVLLRLRAVCEHGAVPDVRDPLRAARTTLTPGLVRWFLFPHAMHFHVEHHLYPQVPHYRLAQCHRELVARGVLERAEVETLRRTLAKVFAAPTAA